MNTNNRGAGNALGIKAGLGNMLGDVPSSDVHSSCPLCSWRECGKDELWQWCGFVQLNRSRGSNHKKYARLFASFVGCEVWRASKLTYHSAFFCLLLWWWWMIYRFLLRGTSGYRAPSTGYTTVSTNNACSHRVVWTPPHRSQNEMYTNE